MTILFNFFDILFSVPIIQKIIKCDFDHEKPFLLIGFKVVDGKLLENGRSIQTRNRKQVIRDFLIYCEGTLSPTQGSPKGSPAGQVPGQVVLVAHNGKSLAFDKLLQEIDKAGLENEFGRIVKGEHENILHFFETEICLT